jgi:hypothetical protein
MKPLSPTQMIVDKYLKETGLSMRKFAIALKTNHASISNWKAGISVPAIFLLLNCRETFTDWRLDFANEVLHVMSPDVFPLPSANSHYPQTELCLECGQEKMIVPTDQSTAGSV